MTTKSQSKRKAKARSTLAGGFGTTTCWAHFGWMSRHDKRTNGIRGHIPHLANTREELLEQFGGRVLPSAIVRVRISVLPNTEVSHARRTENKNP